MELKRYGLKQIVEKEGDYHFGAFTKLSGLPLQPDGQWDKFLPPADDQSRGNVETYACTCYGTCNVLEILSRRLGLNLDFSQRYLAINAGLTVDSEGGDPNAVAEAARHQGLIDEQYLPFDDSVTTPQQFYSPIPMSQFLLSLGKEFIGKYKLEHDTVACVPNFLKEALRYSPLGVSVLAWVPKEGTDMYYFPQGQGYNHWCVLYGYVDGQYWLIWDSYAGNSKKIAWDSLFGYAKRYSLTPQPMTPQDKNIFMQILEALAKVLGLIKQEVPAPVIPVVDIAVPPPVPLQPVEPTVPGIPQPIQPPPFNKNLEAFARAIEKHEAFDKRWCNPGALKNASYAKTHGSIGATPSGFAIFPSYAHGWECLKDFIVDASKSEIIGLHDCTIIDFFRQYASSPGDNPLAYAQQVAAAVGVPANTKLYEIIKVV